MSSLKCTMALEVHRSAVSRKLVGRVFNTGCCNGIWHITVTILLTLLPRNIELSVVGKRTVVMRDGDDDGGVYNVERTR